MHRGAPGSSITHWWVRCAAVGFVCVVLWAVTSSPPNPARLPGAGGTVPPYGGDVLPSSLRRPDARRCRTQCPVVHTGGVNGYPPVAFPPGSGGVNDVVCPTMFRDLADYVVGFPFAHFKESARAVAPDVAVACLGPAPVIYVKLDSMGDVGWLSSLSFGFVLVSGQSDVPAPGKHGALLGLPNLLRWFAQNPDGTVHPKFEGLPIGLNCFEHAPEMVTFLTERGPLGRRAGRRPKLLLVNFGDTSPSRGVVRNKFCGGGAASFATCLSKGVSNNIQGNPHLVQLYSDMDQFKFVLAPPGNGLDTHRLWEALLVGVVPITLSSPLDSVLEGLPVLVVPSWDVVTKQFLETAYAARFDTDWDAAFNMGKLHKRYWADRIEAARGSYAGSVRDRVRCWN